MPCHTDTTFNPPSSSQGAYTWSRSQQMHHSLQSNGLCFHINCIFRYTPTDMAPYMIYNAPTELCRAAKDSWPNHVFLKIWSDKDPSEKHWKFSDSSNSVRFTVTYDKNKQDISTIIYSIFIKWSSKSR